MPYSFLIVAICIIDQAVKIAVERNISLLQDIPVIGEYVSLTYVKNYGAAFGMLESQTILLSAVAGAVFLLAWFYRRQLRQYPKMLQMGIAFTLGGALGNFIDRIRLGYVIDYIDLHFWPVFNIADIMITVGAFWIVIGYLLANREHNKVHDDSGDEVVMIREETEEEQG
ncbi:MAG TPA: signal peptidase II [Bacillota bacterium]|nr:signal peptidase II [Bacillota bacterium]HPT87828.1 signal peptidase II [Bacillota bacterium]